MLQIIRNLGGRPDRQPPGLSGLRINFECCQRGVRLHCGVGHFISNEPRLGNVISFGEALLGIAKNVVIVFFDVVRLVVVDEIGFRFHRFFGIKVGRQYLVFDIDQLQRLLGRGFIHRSYAGDVVAHVADFIYGERMLIMADRKNSVGVRRIFAGSDRDDSVQFLSAGGVNTLNAGVRVGGM